MTEKSNPSLRDLPHEAQPLTEEDAQQAGGGLLPAKQLTLTTETINPFRSLGTNVLNEGNTQPPERA